MYHAESIATTNDSLIAQRSEEPCGVLEDANFSVRCMFRNEALAFAQDPRVQLEK